MCSVTFIHTLCTPRGCSWETLSCPETQVISNNLTDLNNMANCSSTLRKISPIGENIWRIPVKTFQKNILPGCTNPLNTAERNGFTTKSPRVTNIPRISGWNKWRARNRKNSTQNQITTLSSIRSNANTSCHTRRTTRSTLKIIKYWINLYIECRLKYKIELWLFGLAGHIHLEWWTDQLVLIDSFDPSAMIANWNLMINSLFVIYISFKRFFFQWIKVISVKQSH